MTSLMTLLSIGVVAAEQTPDPEDVKAGWLGFAVWIGLAIGVVLLAISFVRQLRKVDFEEEPDEPAGPENSEGTNGAAKPS